MSLPHITNSTAGKNLLDPVFKNIFEVSFSLPNALGASNEEVVVITEHVLSIDGLSALNRTPGTGTQKFMGTDRTYINPKLDNTRAELTVKFSLNLNNATDNYIYKTFRKWARLGYNQDTGERHLKKDCCADFLKVSIANQVGDIYHEVVFRDVMLNGDLEGISSLDYDSNEVQDLTVKFVSDWWQEIIV